MFQDIAAKIQALPPEQKAAFQKAAETIQRNTQQPNPSPVANDNRDSNYALRQKASGQDDVQTSMSPTDKFAGVSAADAKQVPAKAQQAQTQGQTVSAPSAPTPTPNRAPSQGRGR